MIRELTITVRSKSVRELHKPAFYIMVDMSPLSRANFKDLLNVSKEGDSFTVTGRLLCNLAPIHLIDFLPNSSLKKGTFRSFSDLFQIPVLHEVVSKYTG